MSGDLKVFSSNLSGDIYIPGSKSHTIRALVLAGLARGESRICNPLFSQDTMSCLKALEAMGVLFNKVGDRGFDLSVTGIAGKLSPVETVIDVGNSGTSLRILTAVAALSSGRIHFDGDLSIRKRPMEPLLSALKDLGVESDSKEGHAPLSVKGPLKGGKARVDGISSQFLTALLLACPLAPGDTEIEVFNLHEQPYINMTLKWLDRQNIQYTHKDPEHFTVRGGQSYDPVYATISGDFSSAAFPLVAAVITKSKINIKGLDFNDTQGDKRVFDILEEMGAKIRHTQNGVSVERGLLDGKTIDLNDIPDALPALAVLGCFANGETRLVNVKQARLKECDRIQSVTTELRKMGARIRELDDGLVVQKSQLHGTEVKGYDDHRMVMALTLAGLSASGETRISEGFQTVQATYPSFVSDFVQMGARILTTK